jgi:hypothetical protein
MEPEDGEKKSINVPIEWYIPEQFPTPYASNVFVQPGEYEFTISFFSTQLPLLTGTPEENQAKLQQLKNIRAECVGRVIVSPELVPKIIQALQSTLDQYMKVKKAREAIGEQE